MLPLIDASLPLATGVPCPKCRIEGRSSGVEKLCRLRDKWQCPPTPCRARAEACGARRCAAWNFRARSTACHTRTRARTLFTSRTQILNRSRYNQLVTIIPQRVIRGWRTAASPKTAGRRPQRQTWPPRRSLPSPFWSHPATASADIHDDSRDRLGLVDSYFLLTVMTPKSFNSCRQWVNVFDNFAAYSGKNDLEAAWTVSGTERMKQGERVRQQWPNQVVCDEVLQGWDNFASIQRESSAPWPAACCLLGQLLLARRWDNYCKLEIVDGTERTSPTLRLRSTIPEQCDVGRGDHRQHLWEFGYIKFTEKVLLELLHFVARRPSWTLVSRTSRSTRTTPGASRRLRTVAEAAEVAEGRRWKWSSLSSSQVPPFSSFSRSLVSACKSIRGGCCQGCQRGATSPPESSVSSAPNPFGRPVNAAQQQQHMMPQPVPQAVPMMAQPVVPIVAAAPVDPYYGAPTTVATTVTTCDTYGYGAGQAKFRWRSR